MINLNMLYFEQQGALPMILKNTPQKFYDELVETLQNHAEIAFQMLSAIEGIKPIMPAGAMYVSIFNYVNK